MKICIFGASSSRIDKEFIKLTEELGEKMAKRGHSLVFGAGATGLMGAAARGVKRGGGSATGVVPEFFVERGIERLQLDCDEIVYTKTMRERKAIMEERADAFIIVPGGVGTLEEMYEVITLRQLSRHNKAIIVYDMLGYYEKLNEFMGVMLKEQFVGEYTMSLYKTMTSADEILDYLEGYIPPEIPISGSKISE